MNHCFTNVSIGEVIHPTKKIKIHGRMITSVDMHAYCGKNLSLRSIKPICNRAMTTI